MLSRLILQSDSVKVSIAGIGSSVLKTKRSDSRQGLQPTRSASRRFSTLHSDYRQKMPLFAIRYY